jgi:hypothetical protein
MDGAELDGRQASGESSLCGQVTVDDVNHFQWQRYGKSSHAWYHLSVHVRDRHVERWCVLYCLYRKVTAQQVSVFHRAFLEFDDVLGHSATSK